jgi:hypothetical protein
LRKSSRESNDDSFTNLLDLPLDETFKRVVGERFLNINENLEETMNRFLDSLPAYRQEKESNDNT